MVWITNFQWFANQMFLLFECLVFRFPLEITKLACFKENISWVLQSGSPLSYHSTFLVFKKTKGKKLIGLIFTLGRHCCLPLHLGWRRHRPRLGWPWLCDRACRRSTSCSRSHHQALQHKAITNKKI